MGSDCNRLETVEDQEDRQYWGTAEVVQKDNCWGTSSADHHCTELWDNASIGNSPPERMCHNKVAEAVSNL